jgi:hypothetical protein
VLSRARTARAFLDGPTEYPLLDPPVNGVTIDLSRPYEDSDAADMRAVLDQVIAVLAHWDRTGPSPRKK